MKPDSDSDGSNCVEVQFAQVLQQYQKNLDPFAIIAKFASITASQALAIGEQLNQQSQLEGTNNDILRDQFVDWDLETRLWDLAALLYQFRASLPDDLIPQNKLSSLVVKQENYIMSNPKIRELSIIIHWLQRNISSLPLSSQYPSKWNHTKIAVENSDYNTITGNQTKLDLIKNFDADAPLRTNKAIHPDDDMVDSEVFKAIYQLLLSGKTQEAIDYANTTGNFPLALILVGSAQDYVDPKIDFNDTNATSKPSGLKHKLLWKKTVFKLSQQSNLNMYERLIYNYLCGGDITQNLVEANDDWEQSLLLYLSQLFSYHLDTFIASTLPETANDMPIPQLLSVDEILNTLSNSNEELRGASLHPLRVISGGIMINQESTILQNAIQKSQDLSSKPFLIRVITHLIIIRSLILGTENVNTQDITTVITIYMSKLSEYKLDELIPIYLTFIPNEQDAREVYSLFLSKILDEDERSKQIEMSKRIANEVATQDIDVKMTDDEDKMYNTLKMTVERVMNETKSHYDSNLLRQITCDQPADKIDTKLYRSIEWFYSYSMHEDAIAASIVIIRRFLLNGKLDALKKFAQGKNFKKLIKDYDAYIQNRELSDNEYVANISEESKQEFMEYSALVEGLNLIDEWKTFDKLNGKSSLIDTSIEKSSKTLRKLIFNWFKELIKMSSSDDERTMFEEFRSNYIPYLIIELLQIYQKAKDNDWKYIRYAFNLINDVANDKQNDFLKCFLQCGRLQEFLVKAGEISVVAAERGISGIFT
jgi:nuclear pore complex protein Nup107